MVAADPPNKARPATEHSSSHLSSAGSSGNDRFENVRTVWQDHYANLAIERDRWRHGFFVALMFAAIALGLSVWAAVQSRYIPYIVTVDKLGRSQSLLAPRQITNWPDVAVRHEIGTFLRSWRSVSTDNAVMEGRLRRIRYFLETNSAADRKIVAWATNPKTSPFEVAKTYTRDVEVHSVVLVGGRSWLAEWSETTRNRGTGSIEWRIKYQATFVLGQRRVKEERILMQNPLGMVVEDYDLFKVE